MGGLNGGFETYIAQKGEKQRYGQSKERRLSGIQNRKKKCDEQEAAPLDAKHK